MNDQKLNQAPSSGMVQTTGPRRKDFQDLAGTVFNYFTVVDFHGYRPYPNGARLSYWNCRCICGKIKAVASCALKSGSTKSCGCMRKAIRKKSIWSHGLQKTVEYVTLRSMKERCNNTNHPHYDRYGGRGIKVCDQWLGAGGILKFIEDMGMRPSPSHSIDRIDNDKGYTPENCRWATRKQQSRNTSGNVLITMNGVTKCLTEWAEEIGICRRIAGQRIRCGWTHEEALLTPIKHRSKNATH